MEGTAALEYCQTKPLPKMLNQVVGGQAQLKTEESSQEDRMERALVGTSADVIYKLRKQMNQILGVLSRRCEGRDLQKLETMIWMVLDLIRGQDCTAENLYNPKNLQYARNLLFEQRHFGRAKKSQSLRIAIFEPLHSQESSSPSYARLIVIDNSGKIQQYRHHVNILVDLNVCIARLQRMCENLVVLVKKVGSAKQKETKICHRLRRLLRGCEVSEVQCTGGGFLCFGIYGQVSTPQCKLESSYNIFQSHVWEQILAKFYLMRDYLLQNSRKLSKTMQQSAFAYLFPFAYNIISHFHSPQATSLRAQIQLCSPELERIVRHLTHEFQAKKLENREEHFPIALTNAQVCWRCKTRGFICCSTCSTLQAKKIPLCLDCYGPHHQTLIIVKQKQLAKNRLGRWQEMEIQVSEIMQQEWFSLFMRGSVMTKKQQ